MEFEWDDAKARSNLTKHGVAFETAAAVFRDPDLIVVETVREGDREVRLKALGRIGPRVFAVVFTRRRHFTRVISFRVANSGEVRTYGLGPSHN